MLAESKTLQPGHGTHRFRPEGHRIASTPCTLFLLLTPGMRDLHSVVLIGYRQAHCRDMCISSAARHANASGALHRKESDSEEDTSVQPTVDLESSLSPIEFTHLFSH